MYWDKKNLTEGHALIIKGSGPHGFEQASPYFRLRHVLTGFYGTAGTLILTPPNHKDILVTDSRYSEEAKHLLPPHYLLIEEREDNWDIIIPAIIAHLSEKTVSDKNTADNSFLPSLKGLAICDAQHSIQEYSILQKLSIRYCNSELKCLSYKWYAKTLASSITRYTTLSKNQNKDKSTQHLSETQQAQASQSRSWLFEPSKATTKAGRIQTFIQSIPKGATAYLSFSPFEFAYLTAFRVTPTHTADGSNQSNSHTMLAPLAFLLLPKTKTILLWIPPSIATTPQLTTTLQDTLQEWTITQKPYENVFEHSLLKKELPATCAYDPSLIPAYCQSLLDEHFSFFSPIKHDSSILSPDEITGVRNASLRESKSLTRACAEYKYACMHEGKILDEYQLCMHIDSRNKTDPQYIMPSFASIVTTGTHGNMIHHRVSKSTAFTIKQESVVLIDTGSHFKDGSTDITRTLYIGKAPDPKLIHDYTMVLKSHIALCTAHFSPRSSGAFLDTLCRAPMIKHNMDYPHGTGHGIGLCTDVHWGAVFLHKDCDVYVEPGMLLSIEPGYYTDSYGIRLENMALVIELPDITKKEKNTLGFEVLSYVPFEDTLIDNTLLTDQEKTWLAWYQAKSYK